MSELADKPKIVAREPRFVTYIPPARSNDGPKHDFHLVKELLHFEDDTTKPHVRFIKDYKRDYYVTREGFRNHEQKKEWEYLSRLQKYSSRQFELESNIAQTLNTVLPFQGRRALFRNPYIYGADVSSTAILMHDLKKKYLGPFSKYSVAVFDTETDMIEGHGEVIMATISFGSKVYTAVEAAYFKDEKDIEERAKKLFNEELREYIEKRQIEWEFEIVEHRMDIIFKCFDKAHQWQPDWVELWNIDFDISKILAMCERYHVDPADVFSDPRLPRKFRSFRYRKGPVQRKTASGLVLPIKPAAQWHVCEFPASFRLIDGMQAYYHIRTGSAELQSYSMDFIMRRELKLGKLRTTKGSHIREGTADWHIWMQRNAKIEYVIYNTFDCIGLEILDEKTNDLSIALPTHAQASDLRDFDSQPKRKVTELHFFLLGLENPYVIATTSDQMRVPLDDETLPLSGWIVTLDAPLIDDESGLKVVLEHPSLGTRFFIAVAD